VKKPKAWRDRLDCVASHGEGWHDGEGEAIDPLVVDEVRDLLAGHELVASTAGVYPTIEGGILIEWTGHERGEVGARGADLEVQPGRAAEFTVDVGDRVLCFEVRDLRDIASRHLIYSHVSGLYGL
jgi:hypothetical protein